MVETSISEYSITSLLDTGADSCYICENLCNKLSLNFEPYKCDVLVGNNSRLEVTGKLNITISLAQYEYPIDCVVAKNLNKDLILGWNGFIKPYNGKIDAQKGTFQLDSPSNHRSVAYIKDRITVAPYTEAAINTHLKETFQSKLIQIQRYEPLFNRTGITIMPGIHQGKNEPSEARQLNLIIANMSPEPVTLLPYTIVANITKCHDDDVINAPSEQEISVDTANKDKPFVSNKLTTSQRNQVDKLLKEYENLFTTDNKPSQTSKVTHQIDVNNSKPINCAPARHGFNERNHIVEQIADMKSNGIIQDSRSPWASRVVLVKKKDGGLRFCVDYRALNNVTVKDVYPLPRVDDSLALLNQGKFFTTLDMFAGYWQIPLDKHSRDKTAFVTQSGLYEFLVMPFGFSNFSAIYGRYACES